IILCVISLVSFAASPVRSTSQQATGGASNASKVSKSVADPASLITEYDVNGLKVLVKRRVGSLTVSAGLFIRGGAQNVSAANAGIEALMLDLSSEASQNFPRERLRSELSSLGSGISYGINSDYSALSMVS